MWNTDRAAYLNMFAGHGGSVTCGDFTPDGSHFSSSFFANFSYLSYIFLHSLISFYLVP
jgi:hypothetical protein